MRYPGIILGLCLLGLNLTLAGMARAEALKVYVFGNSLVHHLTDSDETTAPHWIAHLARAAGNELALDGQWGFLRDFTSSERPQANWRFAEVPRAWTRQYRSFGDVGWDVVMFNPANFIQYQPADRPYDGKNDEGASPLSTALALIDRSQGDAAPGRFVLYEGWADMGGRFPPSNRQLRKYHRLNAGEYHDWYLDFLTRLRAERPGLRIDMIPVARVLAELFDGGILGEVPVEALYSDNAPHGTATLYLLAGAVAYVGLYEAELPEQVALPESIHADVRNYWDAVRAEIHRVMREEAERMAALEGGGRKVVKVAESTAEEVEEKPLTPFPTPPRDPDQMGRGLGLENPALAMGLGALSDWSTQHPFLDLMKTARPWIGHLPGRWGGVEAEELADRGLLDDAGWVWGIPEGIESVETLILTDQPEEAAGLAGRYRVTWKGAGALKVTGRAREVQRQGRELWFDYTPGDGPVGLKIETTDPERTGDYIHDISVVAERHVALHEAGAMFNPDWLALVADLRMVRFMDWMKINHSTQAVWDDRPRPEDFSWAWRGVPVEVMVRLANEIGADPWFCMPHLADADYQRRFATYVRDRLDPELRAHVEYSNELWNWGFGQTQWALAEAEARWGANAADDALMQYAGMRAGETARLWGEVFGAQAETRLVRVVATHTDWPGLEKGLLQAPLAQAEGLPPPVEAFDAYAVSGYFGATLGMDEGAPQVMQWLIEAEDRARKAGRVEGLKRVALDAHVDAHRHDGLAARAARALREGEMKHVLTKTLPYHAQVARDNGLALVMYEGGSHVAGVGSWTNERALTDFFSELANSPEMGTLYQEMLAGWRDVGGRGFNAYVDVGRASKWGNWGHLRHLWDATPRHDALMAYNAAGVHWNEPRAEGAFLHGGIFAGTGAGDRLEGTVKRDVLLGGPGDDVLVARGRGDLLHGGPGTDRAELPGARGDYSFARDGARVRAESAEARYVLTEIEAVSFAASPALVLPLAGLL